MYLLDTNVVSELRRRDRANPEVLGWATQASDADFYLSTITLMEIETGILLVERKDASKAAALKSWLNGQILTTFSNRIIPIDTAVALRCAALHVPQRRSDRDALIAATALVHSMTVVTRNVADFLPTGVKLLNPWERQA